MFSFPSSISGRSKCALLVVLPALFALAPAAGAASFEGPPEERRHSVRLDVGFLSPVGLAGLAYSYDFTKRLTLEAGLGVGFSGVQLSVMPKLVLGNGKHSALFGLGASVGIDPDSSRHTVWPYLNGEVGYQLRAQNGFTFQASLGVTGSYYKISNHAFSGNVAPTVRIGFGYSF
jgi:hypothetical protein